MAYFSDENYTIAEPPATPGPVFAYRAFRDAFLGTPAVEKQAANIEPKPPAQPLNPPRSRPSENAADKKVDDRKSLFDEPQQILPRPQQLSQPMISPTKSILLTPGTAVARRKTVSFGEGVVDNERKKSNQPSPKKGTPTGTISQQWATSLAETSQRSRSKFTQSLLDAKEKKADDNNDLFDIAKKGGSAPSTKEATRQPPVVEPVRKSVETHADDNVIEIYEDADVTTNLEEPRSQSGIYWKSEYESYRAKTNQEIKKLIQYRSVAKSYAKKKETEAARLAASLKRQEDRVAEMERHVSKLAAGMADSQDSNKEEMFKELSKQTALVLQYKQKAETLRDTLEQNGVLEDGNGNDNGSDGTAQKLRETEAALQKANKLLKAAEQGTKEKELQELAAAAETKAKGLEKENLSLKRNLARTKEEMSKYEDRRKAKETRLKQREQKLESRISEYRTRLKETTRRHRETEEELRNSFSAEKRQLQDTIAALKQKLQSGDRPSREDLQQFENPKRGARAKNSQEFNALEDDTMSGHVPKPRASHPRQRLLLDDDYSGPETDNDLDIPLPSHPKPNHASKGQPNGFAEIEFDQDEPLIAFDDTPKKPRTRIIRRKHQHQRQRQYQHRQEDNNEDDYPMPPSSPPLPEIESSVEIGPNFRHLNHAEPAPPPRPSTVYMGLNPRKSAALARRHGERKTLTAGATRSRENINNNNNNNNNNNPRASARVTTTTSSRLNKQLSLPSAIDELPSSPKSRLDSIPPDRLASAVARLKQKHRLAEAAKAMGGGKENIWTT